MEDCKNQFSVIISIHCTCGTLLPLIWTKGSDCQRAYIEVGKCPRCSKISYNKGYLEGYKTGYND